MSVRESRTKIHTSIIIDRKTHIKLRILAASRGVRLNDVFVVGAELMKTLMEYGTIPDDLGYFLQKENPKLLKKLIKLVRGGE